MAYFDSAELVDYLRHVFSAGDAAGISARVLRKPKRCPRAGGLPLGCLANEDASSDSEEDLAPLNLTGSNIEFNTGQKIRDALLEKIRAADASRAQNPKTYKRLALTSSTTPNLFIERPIIENTQNETSMASRLLTTTPIEPSANAFDSFSRFEATAAMPKSRARTMTIIFSFCKPEPCALPISIITQGTTLADLIGLSCYVYTRAGKQPTCENPSLYSLYLAEEDTLQYDADLPPQDRHRMVADCGFPTLALMKNSETRREDYCINVYFTNGRCANFRLPTLDVPLQWLYDRTLEWRNENIVSVAARSQTLLREIRYVLEPLEQSGVALPLTNTISSTGNYDFVFLRENSARGALLTALYEAPRLKLRDLELSTLAAGTTTGTLPTSQSNLELRSIPAVKKLSISNNPASFSELEKSPLRKVFIPWPLGLDAETLSSRAASALADGLGVSIDEYTVKRRRRLKQWTTVKLTICENGLELGPAPGERQKTNLFLRASTAKNLQIFWEFIASAKVSQPERSKTLCLIRIVWLRVPDSHRILLFDRFTAKESSKPSALYGDEHTLKGLELSDWKTLQLEVGNDDAWKIAMKLSDILDARAARVQRIYQYSYGATKRPHEAADELACHLRVVESDAKHQQAISKAVANITTSTDIDIKSTASSTSSQRTHSTIRSTTLSSARSGKSSTRHKISLNMRGIAFLRVFSKPN